MSKTHTSNETKTTTPSFLASTNEAKVPFFAPASTDAVSSHFSFFSPHPAQADTPLIQPKLTIGAPDDLYEKEADTIADKVVQGAEHSNATNDASGNKTTVPNRIHPKSDAREGEEKLQRQEEKTTPAAQQTMSESDGKSDKALIPLPNVEVSIFEYKVGKFGVVKMSVEKSNPIVKDFLVKNNEFKLVKFEPTVFSNEGFLKNYAGKAAEFEQELMEIEKGISLKAELSFLEAELNTEEADFDLNILSITFAMKGIINRENIDATEPGGFIREHLPDVYYMVTKQGLEVSLSGEVKAAFTAEDLKTLRELMKVRKETRALLKEAEQFNKEVETIRKELEEIEADKSKTGSQANDLQKNNTELSKKKAQLEKKRSDLLKKGKHGKGTEAGKSLKKIEKQLDDINNTITKNKNLTRKYQNQLKKLQDLGKNAEKRIAEQLLKKQAITARLTVIKESAEKLTKKLSGKLAGLVGRKMLTSILKALSVVGLLIEAVEATVAILKIALNFEHIDWIWKGGIPLDEIPIKRIEGKTPNEGDKIAESMDQIKGNTSGNDTVPALPETGLPQTNGTPTIGDGGTYWSENQSKEPSTEAATSEPTGNLESPKTNTADAGSTHGQPGKAKKPGSGGNSDAGSETKQPVVKPETSEPDAGSNQTSTIKEPKDAGSGGTSSGMEPLTGTEEPSEPDAGLNQTGGAKEPNDAGSGIAEEHHEPEADGLPSGKGTGTDPMSPQEREDMYFPLLLSPYAKSVFNTLIGERGSARPKTENDIQRFVDLVDSYQETLSIEEIQQAFQNPPAQQESMSYDEWLLLLKSRLDDLKKQAATAGNQGAGVVPDNEKKEGVLGQSGPSDKKKEQPKSKVKVITDVPSYSKDIEDNGLSVPATRYLFFPEDQTFNNLKIDDKAWVTMSVTTDEMSYSVTEPFEIVIKSLDKSNMNVGFQVTTSFYVNKSNSQYPADHLYHGVFKIERRSLSK